MLRTREDRRAERRRILSGEHDLVSRLAHRRRHTYSSLLYSSKATLSTNAGSPFFPLQAGRLVGVRLQVNGAPTGDLTCDVLFDGVTIYHTSTKPTVPSGQLFGFMSHHQDRISFQPDTKIQVQITTVNGAAGPMHVEFLFEPEYR